MPMAPTTIATATTTAPMVCHSDSVKRVRSLRIACGAGLLSGIAAAACVWTTSKSAAPEPEPQGRNVHPVDMTDLSRLSIDSDGRLYWDGKPVEVRRRISMSRAQVVGASIVAAFVIVGAIGAALQGSAAARDWACRLGWTASYCTLPGTPAGRPDIPA